MPDARGPSVPPTLIRPCREADWADVRRLHIKMALGLPPVVDVDLNEVLATPDTFWQRFVRECAAESTQALFVAETEATCVAMLHGRLQARRVRLSMLFVDGGRRRQGLATGLAAAFDGWSRTLGAPGLVCHIPDVSAATHLAEKLRWHRTEELFSTRHRIEERKWTKDLAAEPG